MALKNSMDDRSFVTRLLKQSILTLCREAVSYNVQLEVDGIVSLTVDRNKVHIVRIHELFLKQRSVLREEPDNQPEVRKTVNGGQNITQVSQPPTVHYDTSLGSVKVENVEETNKDQDAESIHDSSYHKPRDIGDTTANNDNKETHFTESIESPAVQSDSLEVQIQKLPVSTDTNIPCKKCHEVLHDVNSYESHCLKVHSQHLCRVCLSTFTSRNNMKRHVRIHTGVKPYTCRHCMESFARNDDYKRHLLRHTFSKPFRCSICYTGYSDRSLIRAHMIKEHSTTLFQICNQCGEAFVDMTSFEKHKKMHPPLKEYRCTICSFKGQDGLVYHKHMLTHGPPKTYKCDHCEITFSDPFSYTAHLKLHKDDDLVQNYACCFCDLNLPTYEQFHKHETCHVVQGQFVCKVCGKTFRSANNLRNHLLTHVMTSDDKSSYNKTAMEPRKSGDADIEIETNGPRDSELSELNNNKIEVDKDSITNRKPSDDGHSNDYWCTECNQGFETEKLLQDHINNTHETGLAQNSKSSYDISVHHDAHETPFEHLTQEDDEDRLYNEETLCDLPNRNKLFDQETDIDSRSQYENDLFADLKDRAKLTPAEIAITANAVKEVLAIQQKFGIKSQVQSPKSTWAKPVPISGSRYSPVSTSSIYSNDLHTPGIGGKRFSFSDQRPLGISRYQPKITKKPLSYINAGIKARLQKRKLNSPNQDDDNAIDIDMGDSSSNESKTSGPTTLNLKVRNPGFEKVITPDILFKTKAPFTCEVCEETFQDFESFDHHGTAVHRRFICSFCGKVFTSRPNRERHVRYHTGEKPYKCDLCPMAFFRGDDLKYHRTTRHPDVKPFVCGVCTSTFAKPKELEKHLQMYPDHNTTLVF